jgi:Na+-driven multidrug efflux pump
MLQLFFVITSAMFGLTSAGSVRVGTFLGARRPAAAKATAKVTMSLALCLAVTMATLMALFRHDLGKIFSDDPEVWKLTANLTVIVALCYVALSVFYTSMSVLDAQARPGRCISVFVLISLLKCLLHVHERTRRAGEAR